MTRRRLLLVLAAIALVFVCLIPKEEYTFEFDGINLQLRNCVRYRSRLFGFVIREDCGTPQEHPIAAKLREMDVLSPVHVGDERWQLISGRMSGVRGWRGPGRNYIRAIGATTFGTPITMPAQENLADNVWVRWAATNPPAAKHFWQELQSVERKSGNGAYYLGAAKEYLERNTPHAEAAEVETHAQHVIDGL